MHVSASQIDARFFGCPTVAERNAYELSMANFTVVAGENRLQRPVGGGRVESGALRGGEVVAGNLSVDTESGEWGVREFEAMFIEYPDEEE
jgi:alkaline phosphatase D